MTRDSIYLDYSATTPVDPAVLDAMIPFFIESFGNASSVHAHGRRSKAVLERSREIIAQELNAFPGELLFTSGGTEANNTALIGAMGPLSRHGKTHFITSRAEHPSVYETAEYLKASGADVTYLEVNRYGAVDADDLRRALRPETGLVSLMHANNELGTLNDIRKLAEICNNHGALFHTDAVQSYAKLHLDTGEIPVDLISISAHKIYGPKGIGALYIRRGTGMDVFQHGGGQERGRRGGTENVAPAVGFAAAVGLMQKEREAEIKRVSDLRGKLLEGLQAQIPGIRVHTDLENSLYGILNISFDPAVHAVDGEALLMGLDTRGLSVSNGSACTSGSLEPSRVQISIGNNVEAAKSAIRFSLGRYTTVGQIESAVRIVSHVISVIARPVKPLVPKSEVPGV